jgi:hypothetical protein
MFDQVGKFIGGIARGADDAVKSQAAGRMARGRAAGIKTNRGLVYGDTDRDMVISRIMGGMRPPEKSMEAAIRDQLGSPEGRARVARQYAPNMSRGPGGYTDRGLMELVNEGIAENAYVRRGVLPTAVVGGGALMTAGAQQLLALMGFMQEGSQTGERKENSPLA